MEDTEWHEDESPVVWEPCGLCHKSHMKFENSVKDFRPPHWGEEVTRTLTILSLSYDGWYEPCHARVMGDITEWI
jgi:hypothetical protein